MPLQLEAYITTKTTTSTATLDNTTLLASPQTVMATHTTSPTDVNWPALGGGAPASPKKQVGWEIQEAPEQEDWEILSSEASSSEHAEEQSDQENALAVLVSNPKLLHHAASSPDLRRFDLKAVQDAQDDSFSMVSGPASVVSVSSSFSFRDAILASSGAATPTKEAASAASKTQESRTTTVRQKVKPRFVVVQPIKRCAKSTGDLMSLTIHEEEEELTGASDAMEFYHRKALGNQTRKNGLKLRPDEAKRKEMIVHKKHLQRQASQS